MSTTTIRVDRETHRALLEMSARSGSTLVDTVRQAADALRRQQLARQIADEVEALRADPEAWAAYLAEAEATDVSDGLDR